MRSPEPLVFLTPASQPPCHPWLPDTPSPVTGQSLQISAFSVPPTVPPSLPRLSQSNPAPGPGQMPPPPGSLPCAVDIARPRPGSPGGHWQSAPSGAGHARWASAGGAAASGGVRVEGQVRRRAVVMLPAFHFSTQYLPFQFPRQPELAAWPDGQAGPCALDKTRTRPLRVETGAPPAGPSRGHGDILVCRQEAALILAEQARR